MNRHVVVAGGGIAGLTASLYLARAGFRVTVFEKKPRLGGRAITDLRHGYRLNLGAHTFHRDGAGARVCRELGIPIRGSVLRGPGVALMEGRRYRLPNGWWGLATTSLLSLRGKRELAALLFALRKPLKQVVAGQTAQQWLDARFDDSVARGVAAAMLRSATFIDDPSTLDAATAALHLAAWLRSAIFIDEGWQKIVDALQSAAVSSGVNFVTSARIVGIERDDAVHAIRLGGLDLDVDRTDTQSLSDADLAPREGEGARVPADRLLLAVDPRTAAALSGDTGDSWPMREPITAACLDVALRKLPRPENAWIVAIDEPMHVAAHSSWAQLTPKGGAVVHAVRYQRGHMAVDPDQTNARRSDALASADERLLEEALDRFQPGWRELLVHRRFLPALPVAYASARADRERPGVRTAVRGLYLAGDWVGSEGLLSDASFASARAAAQAIIADG